MTNELKEANPAPWTRIQEPTITPGKYGGERETKYEHPAYGMIGASRVSGGTMLYGSDFQHNSFIRITVRESYLKRGLSTDWPHGHDELIELDVSEAQWAQFVSAMNVGFGVQCTLRHVQGEFRPGLPKPASRVDQFAGEAKAKLTRALDELTALHSAIDELKLSEKQKNALKSHVQQARQQFTSNLPFVLQQFKEHMEETVHKARTEVNAYAVHALMKTGLAALPDGGQSLKMLHSESSETDKE
jgi:hypothetical protein